MNGKWRSNSGLFGFKAHELSPMTIKIKIRVKDYYYYNNSLKAETVLYFYVSPIALS